MPRQPSQLTYNDLNGLEAREILLDWFAHLLSSQPLLQQHLTLPKACIRLSIDVSIDMYTGGTVPVSSPPETVTITGGVALNNDVAVVGGVTGLVASTASAPETQHTTLSAVVNAAPIPGGNPPDQIREQHNLPVPRPAYGPRETGSHAFLADVIDQTNARRADACRADADSSAGGRQGIVADGYKFADEPALPVEPAGNLEQVIPVDRGAIEIDRTGAGRMRQGDMVVTAGKHIASAKTAGDQRGAAYGSVASTYDAGPAGLAQPGRSGGLYSDGRTKIAFGNKR